MAVASEARLLSTSTPGDPSDPAAPRTVTAPFPPADTVAYLNRQTARVQGGKVNDLFYVDAVRLGALSAFARLGVPM